MTRRDYVLVAFALQAALDRPGLTDLEQSGIELATRQIASALVADNPGFDAKHFYRTVGIPE